MRSLTMEAATSSQVPSGNALSVDRELFAQIITEKIRQKPNIFIHKADVKSLTDELTILATGPLTSDEMVLELGRIIGTKALSFYDASAPIISRDSVDMSIAYYKSRYEQGDDSYLNCPFDKQNYYRFVEELSKAETVKLHAFESQYFEGCLPIEVLAKRGIDTLAMDL